MQGWASVLLLLLRDSDADRGCTCYTVSAHLESRAADLNQKRAGDRWTKKRKLETSLVFDYLASGNREAIEGNADPSPC